MPVQSHLEFLRWCSRWSVRTSFCVALLAVAALIAAHTGLGRLAGAAVFMGLSLGVTFIAQLRHRLSHLKCPDCGGRMCMHWARSGWSWVGACPICDGIWDLGTDIGFRRRVGQG